MAFANMAQATAEDCTAVTNLMAANSILAKQVVLYTNRLSTRYADNVALQTVMKILNGYDKNFKAKAATLKRSVHYSGAGATNKDGIIPETNCDIEGQAHHPTWCSTP